MTKALLSCDETVMISHTVAEVLWGLPLNR